MESNSKIKITFNEGDLSSDSGLLLIKEFAHKFGFNKHISQFETDENDILVVIRTTKTLPSWFTRFWMDISMIMTQMN